MTKALEGDTVALRLCMELIAPDPRDHPVSFSLPNMKKCSGRVRGRRKRTNAVSEGELTPIEATRVMGLIDS